MSLGLAVFDRLCETANALVTLRDETCAPGSDAWCALTELASGVDALIDRVVEELALPELEEEV